jgi:hypothetical protein
VSGENARIISKLDDCRINEANINFMDILRRLRQLLAFILFIVIVTLPGTGMLLLFSSLVADVCRHAETFFFSWFAVSRNNAE